MGFDSVCVFEEVDFKIDHEFRSFLTKSACFFLLYVLCLTDGSIQLISVS